MRKVGFIVMKDHIYHDLSLKNLFQIGRGQYIIICLSLIFQATCLLDLAPFHCYVMVAAGSSDQVPPLTLDKEIIY